MAALFLRNAERTAIVCDVHKIPIDLIRDTYGFTTRAKSDSRVVRTEVLLTEEAMDLLGNISDVVSYFEKQFIAN